MRKEPAKERVRVGTLQELNAIVGRFLTGESPQTHWEDSHSQLQFDSIEEALEALREPYFQKFIPEDARAKTFLREVQEFRDYSSDLATAWELVEKLSNGKDSLHIRLEGERWRAAFGESEAVVAKTAPIAICLAALRHRGVEVEMNMEPELGLHPGTIQRLLRTGTLAD